MVMTMSKPVPNAMMSQRVAFRFRLAARPQIPTLWYENEVGEKWVQAVLGRLVGERRTQMRCV